MFFVCSIRQMPRITTADVASAILDAPAWVLLGLAVRDERMRERAANELAQAIVGNNGAAGEEANQMALPF
jgi:hypothetical protein